MPVTLLPWVLLCQWGRKGASDVRCPPLLVKDDRGHISRLGDYHSHPWAPSPLSQDDKRQNLQYYSIRIQFDSACHVMKLIPYLGENRSGEVYLRQGKTWVLVGYIKPENKETGIMTPVD